MSRNTGTPHARPGARNRNAGGAPLLPSPAPDGQGPWSAGQPARPSARHLIRSYFQVVGTLAVEQRLATDLKTVLSLDVGDCAWCLTVAPLGCGQPVGQRISGRQRCADRRGSISTDTLDRAVSRVVGAGDVGVEPCGGAPPKPLTDPYVLRPSPSRSPAALHVYLKGAPRSPALRPPKEFAVRAGIWVGRGHARRADRWLDNRGRRKPLRFCAPAE
jgi:hypothetical protein